MANDTDHRGVQMLRDIAEVVATSLIDAEISLPRAREIGLIAAETVRSRYGGEQLYMPKGIRMLIDKRDREIYGKYTGANTYALAKAYALTERQIYGIVAKVREDEFQRRQPGFDFAAGDDP
jgi:Mor family transcriptional regulator